VPVQVEAGGRRAFGVGDRSVVEGGEDMGVMVGDRRVPSAGFDALLWTGFIL
jgi:hypothetical protein